MKPAAFNREIFGTRETGGSKTSRHTTAQHTRAKRLGKIRRRALVRARLTAFGEAPAPDEEPTGAPADGLDELEVLPDV